MITADGRHEPMPLELLLDMVERHAHRPNHVAFNGRGVKIGLPPDVITIQIGAPADQQWFNVRKGYIPEHKDVRARDMNDFSDMLEVFEAMGMKPDDVYAWERKLTTRRRRVHTIGWREVLSRMIRERMVRPNDTAEEWLGSIEYDRMIMDRGRAKVEGNGSTDQQVPAVSR